MVFWIVVVLLGLAYLGTWVYGIMKEGIFYAFLASILTALIGGFVSFVVVALFTVIPGYDSRSWDTDLTALRSDASIEGRSYFLGGGYVEGKRVLNFITREDGAYVLGQVDANESRIYESDDVEPHIESTQHFYNNPWVMPFGAFPSYTYKFYVPTGSVLSEYTVDNG